MTTEREREDTSATPMAVEVFCAYSPSDERWCKQLNAHLSALKRQGLLFFWYDQHILPGVNWAEEIDVHLETASIILLMISPDFLNNDYCYNTLMKRALERYHANEARVIPLIVRHCDWKYLPIGKLPALPTNTSPISTWKPIDAGWEHVVVELRRLIEDLTLHEKRTIEKGPIKQNQESPAKQSSVFLEKSLQNAYIYDVAFSYAIEDRAYALSLISELQRYEVRVFDYASEKYRLWGQNLDTYLPYLYQKQAKYCIMLISKNYVKRPQMAREREAALSRALFEGDTYLLPIYLDKIKVSEPLSLFGSLTWQEETISSVVNHLLYVLGKSGNVSLGANPPLSIYAPPGIGRNGANPPLSIYAPPGIGRNGANPPVAPLIFSHPLRVGNGMPPDPLRVGNGVQTSSWLSTANFPPVPDRTNDRQNEDN